MKGLKAHRIKIRFENIWESPLLHILLTKEEDVVVARCLDFTVSSHGINEEDALNSLAGSIKEYVVTAVENDAIDTVDDPAHSKYWRMYNDLEAKHSIGIIKKSLKKSLLSVPIEKINRSMAEINYV